MLMNPSCPCRPLLFLVIRRNLFYLRLIIRLLISHNSFRHSIVNIRLIFYSTNLIIPFPPSNRLSKTSANTSSYSSKHFSTVSFPNKTPPFLHNSHCFSTGYQIPILKIRKGFVSNFSISATNANNNEPSVKLLHYKINEFHGETPQNVRVTSYPKEK